jgi:hypothetical protein
MAKENVARGNKKQEHGPEGGSVEPREVEVPRRRERTRAALVWIAAAFLVVALAAVGILVWRSVTLSDALAKATATTTTTTNPWGEWGSYSAYQGYSSQFSAIVAKREELVTQTNALNDKNAGHSKYLFRADGDQELIRMIQAMPRHPGRRTIRFCRTCEVRQPSLERSQQYLSEGVQILARVAGRLRTLPLIARRV